MIIPLMHMLSLAVLWVTPLSLPNQHRLFVLTEILNAWSALEVFVVSVIVALLELPTFAQFIIGDMCDIPNDLITTLDHSTPPAGHANDLIWRMLTNIGHGEDKCFDVKAVLEPGCWILFAAFLIAIVVIQLVTRSCAQAMDERLYRRTGRISRASGLDHVVSGSETRLLEDEALTCRETCAARNKACTAATGVSFLKCMASTRLVTIDNEDTEEEATFSDYNAWRRASLASVSENEDSSTEEPLADPAAPDLEQPSHAEQLEDPPHN